MHNTVKRISVNGVMLLLVAAGTFASHSGVAAQAVQYRTQTTAPRLEASDHVRPSWTEVSAQKFTFPENHDVHSRISFQNEQERRPFFSQRGALIGAALGCAFGAFVFYDTDSSADTEEVSHRLGRSAVACVVISIPSAAVGAVLIP